MNVIFLKKHANVSHEIRLCSVRYTAGNVGVDFKYVTDTALQPALCFTAMSFIQFCGVLSVL